MAGEELRNSAIRKGVTFLDSELAAMWADVRARFGEDSDTMRALYLARRSCEAIQMESVRRDLERRLSSSTDEPPERFARVEYLALKIEAEVNRPPVIRPPQPSRSALRVRATVRLRVDPMDLDVSVPRQTSPLDGVTPERPPLLEPAVPPVGRPVSRRATPKPTTGAATRNRLLTGLQLPRELCDGRGIRVLPAQAEVTLPGTEARLFPNSPNGVLPACCPEPEAKLGRRTWPVTDSRYRRSGCEGPRSTNC
jgi:hypothetical protein